MTNSYRKEYPFVGYAGFGGGAPGLSFKSAATKKYIDDIFSLYVWAGNNTIGRDIVNNIDLADKGGMVWAKKRELEDHIIVDTVRGANNFLLANTSAAQSTSNSISAFNSNGFTVDNNGYVNANASTYVGWTFAKQEGFFDIVTYTGDSNTNQTISHSLGSIPGCIMIKSTSNTDQWTVYHRGAGQDKYLYLNESDAASSSGSPDWSNISSTSFEALGATSSNENGYDYVAYIFAGGASDAATARSVHFDGNDYLEQYMASNTDFEFLTGDFTFEAWIKPDNWNSAIHPIFCAGSQGYSDAGGLTIGKDNSNFIVQGFQSTTLISTTDFPEVGQWTHVAVTRSGTDLRLFYNGELIQEVTSSYSFSNPTFTYIGENSPGLDDNFEGSISNLRVLKGTAVYTSAFNPPTEPLTNITNTVLLCCNDSSATGSTVTPESITAGGDPTASTDNPFDDTTAFTFGEGADQNVIKCGSYEGNSSDNGPEIFLGFEPSYVLIKNSDAAYDWVVFDLMRGIATGSDDPYLRVNTNAAETDADRLSVTPTGFKITANSTVTNASNKYIYIAIRRPDGYVGKPAEAGTDVFAMDTGNGSSIIPTFDSGFPVDMTLRREPASSMSFWLSTRLQGPKDLGTAATYTGSESSDTNSYTWDSNEGWASQSGWGSSQQSWMWKRGQGLDVVTYTGNGTSTGDTQNIPHGLNKIPEMAWIKNRDATQDWGVYHKDMHSSIPQLYYMKLNTTDTRIYDNQTFDTPTATHFNLRHNAIVNQNNADFVMMLFSSVSGISKVGNYTGTGSTGLSVNVGFQPRFILFRGTGMSGPWRVLDSVRGMSSGNDSSLSLNSTAAAVTNFDWLDVTSTGFTINTTDGEANASGENYIYYAHA